MKKIFSFIIVLLFWGLSPKLLAKEYERLGVAIHVHSNVSDGRYSIEKIADLAKEYGIGAVIITDDLIAVWEYGPIPFLRKIIRKKVSEDSIFTYGIKRYLDEIEETNNKIPEVILIPGCEVSPYYYWTGSYFKGDLTLNDSNKDLLVFGLKNKRDYSYRRMSPYKGNLGTKPYQDFIDYVISKSGLVFWSSPEVYTNAKIRGINVVTEPYGNDLLFTRDYTGFASIYEGYREVGGPGGIWDKVLEEYCVGKRRKPVWTIGEMDYNYEGETKNKILNEVQTVCLVKEKTQDAVLDALRCGRSYALRRTKEYQLVLEEFSARNEEGVTAQAGEEIASKGKVLIKADVGSLPVVKDKIRIRLIRNGSVIKTFYCRAPSTIRIFDKAPENRKSYYRLIIDTRYPHMIITNPIFVSNIGSL